MIYFLIQLEIAKTLHIWTMIKPLIFIERRLAIHTLFHFFTIIIIF